MAVFKDTKQKKYLEPIERACRDIGEQLYALVPGHLSQEDFTLAFVPKADQEIYRRLDEILGGGGHTVSFAFRAGHESGGCLIRANLKYCPFSTVPTPDAPKATRERIWNYVNERMDVCREAANVWAVIEVLNTRCASYAEMLFLFPSIEAILEFAIERSSYNEEHIVRELFNPFLKGNHKRGKYLPLIEKDFQEAIDRAKFTVAKWMLLNGAPKPERHPDAVLVVIPKMPEIEYSWGTVPAWTLD